MGGRGSSCGASSAQTVQSLCCCSRQVTRPAGVASGRALGKGDGLPTLPLPQWVVWSQQAPLHVGYQCRESTSSGRRLSFLRLS